MLLGDLAAGAPAAGIALSVGYLRDAEGNPAATALRERGVEPQLVPVRRMLEPGALPRLRAHLRQAQPDLLHTHLGLADVLGTIAARSLGIPSLSTIHLVARQTTGRPADETRRGITKARLAAFARRHAASKVIAVSEAARDAYLGAGWDSPEHVITVHNGIAREPRPGAGKAMRAELGIPPDALVASTVTVLRRDKGHDIAFGALAELLPQFPQLRLVVLGDGSAREEIRRLAAPLGDAVIFTGHRGDVMAALAATDVLLHPTLMDAFPTALLESAAAEVPVIATAVGGIPEIVLDGQTGFLLPQPPTACALGRSLEQLLRDSDMRRRMGHEARKRFEAHFTATRWAMRLREVYGAVLAQQPAPRSRSGSAQP